MAVKLDMLNVSTNHVNFNFLTCKKYDFTICQNQHIMKPQSQSADA